MEYEYKVINYKEKLIGTILFGSSTMDVKKIEDVINHHAKEKWELINQIIEHSRFLFWSREIIIMTFKRTKT